MTQARQHFSANGLHICLEQPAEGVARLVYVGRHAPRADDLLPPPQLRPAGPDQPVAVTLCPLEGAGFTGQPGLDAVAGNAPLLFDFQPDSADIRADGAALGYLCRQTNCRLQITLDLLPAGVLRTGALLQNGLSSPLVLLHLASLAVELPGILGDWQQRSGGWADEGHTRFQEIAAGRYENSARGGRPGFAGSAMAIVGEAGLSEHGGCCWGAALGWSGNSRTFAERLAEGSVQLQLAALLQPGEIVLETGEAWQSPHAFLAVSDVGLNGLSRSFHILARALTPAPPRLPVQFNSWEAVTFDYDEARAMTLATAVAALGVERFVLDDGWFRGRHDDSRALGDWTPDPERFAYGLAPLAAHVTALKMEFGLWVEPEMISPDSDLYRSHPDWCLAVPEFRRPTGRSQLVLDLSRAEVADYLYGVLSDLLTGYPIHYLKWDHNRALYPLAGKAEKQVHALYELLARLRAAFPDVEFESCASGGGRMDFGILPFVSRFWTSDNTDAVERIRIQRAASQSFPLALLGCHIGPSPSPLNGRDIPVIFRAIVAFFGHMGLEEDPARLTRTEQQSVATAFAAFKAHRALIRDGSYQRLEPVGGVFLDAVYSDTMLLLRILAPAGADKALTVPLPETLSAFGAVSVQLAGGLEARRQGQRIDIDPCPPLSAVLLLARKGES